MPWQKTAYGSMIYTSEENRTKIDSGAADLLPDADRFRNPKWLDYMRQMEQYAAFTPDFSTKDPEGYKKYINDAALTSGAAGQVYGSGEEGAYPAPTTGEQNVGPVPEEAKVQTGIPEGYKGGATGPYEEPLPQGATAYNVLGEPTYTPLINTTNMTPEQRQAFVRTFGKLVPTFEAAADPVAAIMGILPEGLQQFAVDVVNEALGVKRQAEAAWTPEKQAGRKIAGAQKQEAGKTTFETLGTSAAEHRAELAETGKPNVPGMLSALTSGVQAGFQTIQGWLDQNMPSWLVSLADSVGTMGVYGLNKTAEYSERMAGYFGQKAAREWAKTPLPESWKKKMFAWGEQIGVGYTAEGPQQMSDVEIYEISKMAWTNDPIITTLQEYVAKGISMAAKGELTPTYLGGKYDVANQDLSSAWKELASHVESSLAQNTQRRNDFLTRYRLGDNPTDLTLQFSNPARELIGQVIFDPSNYVFDVVALLIREEKMAKALAKIDAFQGAKIGLGDEAMKAARKEQELLRAGKATDAKAIGAMADFSRGRAVAEETAKQVAGGKGIKGIVSSLLAPTAQGNVNKALNSLHIMTTSIFAAAKKNFTDAAKATEYMISQFTASAIVARGPSVGKEIYDTALKVIGKGDACSALLSEEGMKAGKIIGDVLLDSAGKFDEGNVAQLARAITSAGEDVLSISTKLSNEVEKLFPTIAKRIEYEDDAAKLIAAGQKFEDLPSHLQKWAGNPVSGFYRTAEKVLGKGEKAMNLWMPFMSKVYIRKNPAVITRNLIQNELQIFIDYGLKANLVDPFQEMRTLEKFVLESRGARKSFSSGMAGIAGDLERITGFKDASSWEKAYKSASIFEKTEMLAKAQVAVTSMHRSLDWLTTFKVGDDTVLRSLGLSDDVVRQMNHAAIQGFDARAVAEKIANGEIVRSLDALINDSKAVDQMRAYGVYDMMNDLYVRGKTTDEDMLSVVKRIEESMEQAKAEPRLLDASGNLDDFSRQLLQWSEEDMANGVIIDDLVERSNVQYHVAMTEATSAFDGSVTAGHNALWMQLERTPENQQIVSRYGMMADRIKHEIDAMKQSVIREISNQRMLWREEKKIAYEIYRSRANKIIKQSHLDQLNKFNSGLAELQELVNATGKTIDIRQMKIENWVQAEDEFGLLLSMDNIGNDWFNLCGRRINLTGEGGPSPILRILDSYDLKFPTRNGQKYSFYRIRKFLEENGISISAVDIARGNVDEATLTKIDNLGKFLTDPMSASYRERMARTKMIFEELKKPEWEKFMEELDDIKLMEERAVAVPDELGNFKSIQELQEYTTTRKKEIYSKVWQSMGDTVQTALGDAVGSGSHVALSDQELFARNMVKDISQKMRDDVAKTPNPYNLTDEGRAALFKWADDTDLRFAEARPFIMSRMDADIEHTLLDYSNKRGFDRLLSFVFPYHYWYSRTYYEWLKRIPQNYWVFTSYAKYRRALEKAHAGMPNWWKYQINSNEIFGLDWENPVMFNLEATLNPLNGLTGQDFYDPDRRASWFTTMMDDIGKYGPSLHTPYLLAIATYYALQGENQVQIGVDSEGNPIYKTGREVAESWAGRLIPQTAPIKAISTMLGLNPEVFGKKVGGVELDPSIWLFSGGMDKYAEGRVARILADMERRGEITHAESIEAGYRKKGSVWEAAVMRAEQARAGGNLLGGTLGVGFKGRSQGEILIDQFNTEMNALYQRLPNLSPQERQQAWNALFQKYPYASSYLMSRRNSLQRDEAFTYDVLRRVPPGQLDEICKAIGMDYELVNKFYENGYLGLAETDRMRLLAGIRDVGAMAEMPPLALRHEWDSARERYSVMLAEVSQTTLDAVDEYYKVKDTNQTLGEQYLQLHPEVSQFLDWKARQILQDPLLQEYYGGIDFIEGYYRRIVMGAAEAQWPGIGELIAADNELRANGGDYKTFESEYPEIAEYRAFMKRQKIVWMTALDSFAEKLPEKPEMIWRTDAKQESLASMEFMKQMGQGDSADAVSSLAAPYMPEDKDDFDIEIFISDEAEKRWPGISVLYARYNELKGKDKKAASAMAFQYPEINQYMDFAKEVRKNYREKMKGQTSETQLPSTWDVWSTILQPNIQRLLEDYFNGGAMSASLRENLYRTWQTAGSPGGSFEAWLMALRSSYSGTEPLQ